MKFGFEEPQSQYDSGSQRARIWTEQWVSQWMYCINCGNAKLAQFTANLPVADFFCPACNDQFELKAQRRDFGKKVADGAYFTKIGRLASSENPNLMLLKYDQAAKVVTDVCVVPKHFFIPDIIEQRPPLSLTARRAGWIGSNILLNRIPESGRIYVVRNNEALAKNDVISKWQRTLFLRDEELGSRRWLIEVMKCVDRLGKVEFDIDDVYSFESKLADIYPQNRHVRPKIRQQLQVLRDNGYLEFLGGGRYRLTRSNS
jgi:type II restriction enzyme